MSYIQFHLTQRWNSLKTNCNQLQHTSVLEPYKNNTTKVEKPYFSTPCTPRNLIIEWLTLTPLTRMNKGKITPERRCKNSKPVAQLQQNRTSTFTKIKALLEQSHLKIFLKNLQKLIQSFLSHWKCLISVKTVISQQPFMWEKPFFI